MKFLEYAKNAHNKLTVSNQLQIIQIGSSMTDIYNGHMNEIHFRFWWFGTHKYDPVKYQNVWVKLKVIAFLCHAFYRVFIN